MNTLLSADRISDMSSEELFEVIKPVLYLVPLVIVIILGICTYRLVSSILNKTAYKRLITYMDTPGGNEAEKREALTKHFMRASWSQLKKGVHPCPLCAEIYSIKKVEYNSRGDVTNSSYTSRCPRCNTAVSFKHSPGDGIGINYFALNRAPTNLPEEKEYEQRFAKLCELNDYYMPFVDTASGDSGNDINVTITFN